ncbi:hypothetical protein K439DRAFT_1639084 [Ramaria rubella]|nr:hypothetical protein K439DRAFT_1639084 [Ramaria rubella]
MEATRGSTPHRQCRKCFQRSSTHTALIAEFQCNTECAGVSPALTSCAEAQATLTAAPTGPVTSCSCDPTVLSAFQTCFNCAVANGLDSAAQAQTGLQGM